MMNKMLVLIFFSLISKMAFSGVKVTSLDLKTNGPVGTIHVALEGRSAELPDIKVVGNMIEVIVSDADSFLAITKNINGALLSANVLNGKAIIKAILPYEVDNQKVDLGWKNNKIEILFPRGVSARAEAPKPVPTIKKENTILAKIENTQVKEKFNEDYLNQLVEEEKNKKIPQATDVVAIKQAAVEKQSQPVVSSQISNSAPREDFSMATYAAKFSIFLALVLGLFYGIVQLLKRGVFNKGKLGFLSNSQMIQVLSTTYVAPKRSLMIVKAHRQIFLVANSESGLEFLSEMTDTTGLLKEGEKEVTGTNFDLNLGEAGQTVHEHSVKLKENIQESTPIEENSVATKLIPKDIVKFSDELKKKAKKLKPIEFN